MEALRAANRGMARAVCQGAKTAKRYAALGAGMEVDAQGYGREPTAMVRGVLSCLFVSQLLTNMKSSAYSMSCHFSSHICCLFSGYTLHIEAGEPHAPGDTS